MAYDVSFKRGTSSAFNALETKDNKTLYFLTDTNQFFIGSHELDNESLDVNEFALAEVSEGVVTLHGIKETDGKIAVGTITANDIVLAKVATTGTAADVAVVDADSNFEGDNVEEVLAEIADALGEGVEGKTIYMTDNTSTAGTDYASIYKIYQGAEGSAASPVAGELVGTINIPKDQFVESAELVDITYNSADGKLYDGVTDVTALIKGDDPATAADAGKYAKLVFAVTTGGYAKDTIYINIKSLIDVYTSGSAATDEIVITVDSNTNQITAAPGTNGIQAAHISVADTAGVIAATDVEGALEEIAEEIDDMDAVADATKTAIDGSTARTLADPAGVSVLQSITEVDGKITAMGVAEVAQIGSDSGRTGSGTEQDPYVYANTVRGAKTYAEDVAANAINDLDVTEFPLAEVSNNVVTIHGISETDGEIAVGTAAANDIVLEEVAYTGAAADVSIDATTQAKFASATTAQAALAELADALTWGTI